MEHSVKDIGQRYQELSQQRKENPIFESEKFFEFAKQNSNKYSNIEDGEDLLVSTWYSDKLIEDFKNILKQ